MNVEEVKKIVLLCQESSLSHFKFSNGDNIVEFNKNSISESTNIKNEDKNETVVLAERNQNKDECLQEFMDIKSTFVGVVLLEPVLKNFEGEQEVKKDMLLCSIEAMKIYNEIMAPFNGYITEVLVKDGDFVEFDQILFRIRKERVER